MLLRNLNMTNLFLTTKNVAGMEQHTWTVP
jgi:hypothetical protein